MEIKIITTLIQLLDKAGFEVIKVEESCSSIRDPMAMEKVINLVIKRIGP